MSIIFKYEIRKKAPCGVALQHFGRQGCALVTLTGVRRRGAGLRLVLPRRGGAGVISDDTALGVDDSGAVVDGLLSDFRLGGHFCNPLVM